MRHRAWRFPALLPVVLGLLCLASCKEPETEPTGTIDIVSVDPDSGLEDGVLYTFTVVVDYTLDEGDGEIGIGFNTTDDPDVYVGNAANNVIVSERSGRVTLIAGATAKDWSASGEEFRVRVSISRHPHGDTWVPLDADMQALTFM